MRPSHFACPPYPHWHAKPDPPMTRYPAFAALLMLTACSQAETPVVAESTTSEEQVTSTVPAAPAIDPYADARPVSFSHLLDRPRESADALIRFGHAGLEYGELWMPEGDGPFPVVLMVHGGCWLADLPGTILMDYLAADLRARGIAVWNLEYARVGHADGGYSATFLDIVLGVDHLGSVAQNYPLDLDRVVFVGHSAGGHLAMWAAARPGLPVGNLREDWENPLLPNSVITLAGINDLEDYRDNGPGRCGEPETVNQLVDAENRDDPFSDTSPARLLPIGVRQIVISGEVDPIVPPELGARYTDRAQAAGDDATHIILEEAGHFELIDPISPAWAEIVAIIEDELR
jgi:acetyl esterase/lipase